MKLPKDFGHCFDSAGIEFLKFPPGAILCHGIGTANMPGQEGDAIAHAWIEFEGLAYDTVWRVAVPIQKYREYFCVSYCVEYPLSEVLKLWGETDYPGPWDEKIKAQTTEGKKERVNGAT